MKPWNPYVELTDSEKDQNASAAPACLRIASVRRVESRFSSAPRYADSLALVVVKGEALLLFAFASVG